MTGLTHADALFEQGARHIMAGEYDSAVQAFTKLIAAEARSIRGYLGRADANAAYAAEIAERYRAGGGKQFQLTREELLGSTSQFLQPPEKERWWRLTEKIMKLQHAATTDYQRVLEFDRQNRQAWEGLSNLGQ
jgi:hypothetical protein